MKFKDNNFNDPKTYLQFASSRYWKQVHYLERKVTILEPHQWAQGLERSILLNMLHVPHFAEVHLTQPA